MENIVKRKILTEKYISCPKCGYGRQTVEDCKKCVFYMSTNDGEIECAYNRQIMLTDVHVTQFHTGDYEYNIKQLDRKTYEEHKTEIDKDGGDCCCLCCFNQKLNDDNEYCLLRCGVTDEEVSSFICYEDEYWVENKIGEE